MPPTAETVACQPAQPSPSSRHAVHDFEFEDSHDPTSVADASSWAISRSSTSASVLKTPAEGAHHDAAMHHGTPAGDGFFEQYVLQHCKICACDLKSNALVRMRDLRALFATLEQKRIVRMTRSERMESIFGFSHFFVNEVADFNEEVTQMVRKDLNRCWHANGRRTLTQPTSTVYELLRQLGVHPIKGTRGTASEGTPSGSRDFMFYKEYAFSLERLQRNSSRLKIGVIGNRRS